LKLDLHTHCGEATASSSPTEEIIRDIVASVRARGLDGIAITEHWSKTYGYEAKEMVEKRFGEEILVIPGQEDDRIFIGEEKGFYHSHIVELDLPCGLPFRFVAHPGDWYVDELWHMVAKNGIHGIEIANPNHDDEMDTEKIRELAEAYDLILLRNSDAHHLGDIGVYYNELELDDLCARARRG